MKNSTRAARIGLVLAGGGARGAYQVGVMEYLAEVDISLAAVAGTSIGALNGAVVAAQGSPDAAVEHLVNVWDEVGRTAGHADSGLGAVSDVVKLARGPVLHPEFIDGVLDRHVDLAQLCLPFWVAAFPGVPDDNWFADIVRSVTGAQSEWIKVNDLAMAQRKEAVLASAALPFIVPGRRVDDRLYRDGALGGVYANAPLGSLMAESPLDLILVTHLQRGVLWDASRYPTATVLEIRPSEALVSPGVTGNAISLLDFSARRLNELRELGYRDAERTITTARVLLGPFPRRREAQDVMLEAVRELDSP
ncbi:patatin-like phospholipase family protein [Streptomyces doebereineriae]|uniref:Patatin-like phospholipase family protein n=1 Tax=Streptomyces doebereineriae TaxID=3075528 RepID=A0ABU2VCE8_9ACTN|nr:patatin-like phospholipase family protein [Streptomyces sp. DSM 41640]MDT0483028.1 patatin-like phospholipase family protein [Streptomyces sp. DSM 41640]